MIPASLRRLVEPLTRRVAATYHAAERATDFARHLIEIETRLAVVELDQSDFDRDLGRVEAVVREHHVDGPSWTTSRRGAR